MRRARRSDNAVAPPNWPKRLGWLVLIWVSSVAALGAVALMLRLLMAWAGLSAA